MLKKLNKAKIGTKKYEQEKVIANLDKFYHSREEVQDYIEMLSDTCYEANQNETKQDVKGLKILTPKQMLQRLRIALAQVKAANNSEVH